MSSTSGLQFVLGKKTQFLKTRKMERWSLHTTASVKRLIAKLQQEEKQEEWKANGALSSCHLPPLQPVLPRRAFCRESFSALPRDCPSNRAHHISSSTYIAFCLLQVKRTGWMIGAIVRVLSTQSSKSGHFPRTDFLENPPTQLYRPIMLSCQGIPAYI